MLIARLGRSLFRMPVHARKQLLLSNFVGRLVLMYGILIFLGHIVHNNNLFFLRKVKRLIKIDKLSF
jgi:hypothetical protein